MRALLLPLLVALACTPKSEAPPASNDAHAESTVVHTDPPAPESPRTFTVKAMNLQCVAAPCPGYEIVQEGQTDAVLIHGLDLGPAGLTDAQRAAAEASAQAGTLRVRGLLETRAKAGPAGDAVTLKVSSLP